ncbi:Related to protein LAC1 [Taphrina deformans PYCC 5710]|uniref:Related to protein LAC1 n=1 Tax=Taphrina deformans (strain PYCC 5710 / ATCC 11124 / CBS 356.35 / IMI 108563 / JCM 9778 / NBRC 8474) TaxID=1097556 RepID=R4XCY6_TAPDE|nr:Related to protein LAC1 [Taphrina deformans PYCC 5710]|eukprot:CCG83669.1 Related to protein LAC1 [Taphrina deformans PYCC 5710]
MSETCGKGIDDAYLVFSGILFFTIVRAFMMTYIFTPFGRSQGICRAKPVMRFAEQAWGCSWALTSWSCGMYLFYYSSYWLNLDEFYSTWPEIRLDPLFKLYYLMQISFWLQCILALNLEAKRKDYVQMFGHHILTSTLLIASYAFNTTRVGHVILTLMDFADIFLPLAKMLKYLGYQNLCDGTFVIFLASWVVTRHYLLVKIIIHAHVVQPIKLKSGRNITWCFVAMLAGLEALICVWSYAIGRVLWGIIRGGNADDSRSDTEDSDEEPDKPVSRDLDLPEVGVNGGLLVSSRTDVQANGSLSEKKRK